MMELFLGVDGGQSSTTALIGDETGRVIGLGRGGPCNHVQSGDGRTKFVNAINTSLAEAFQSAGLNVDSARFASACLGFSGGPADKQALLEEMLRADRMTVTHDGLIALSGATAGQPGIIVIAGTGSLAFGRNADGQSGRAGGWGYVFGDEGGGFHLTRQALRAALRHEEGWGPPTALRQILLEVTGATNANDLLHRFYTTEYPRPRIASFAKLVDEAAIEGDSIAQKLLVSSAQELATIAAAVRHQLFRPHEAVQVAHVGSVFRSAMLLQHFRMVLEIDEEVHVIAPLYGPAAGALIESYRTAGKTCALTQVPESEK